MGDALSQNPHCLDGTGLSQKEVEILKDGNNPQTESILLSQLVQLLGQRPKHSLLLSDLGALLPQEVRNSVKEMGGLRGWLQKFPGLFQLSGAPGKESVTLIIGSLSSAGSTSALGPMSAGMTNSDSTSQAASTELSTATVAELHGEVDEEDFSAVQLRGLPYRATVKEIKAFLGSHVGNLKDESSVQMVLNRDGRPSGFARVQLVSPEAAIACRDELHLQSMEDRYVEVFLYTERPNKTRLKKIEDGQSVGELSKERLNIDISHVTKEQVAQECRIYMMQPGRQKLLLSMLGVALSQESRAFLKKSDLGLKHFLAQFPEEWTVEGSKGCECVTHYPPGSGGPPEHVRIDHLAIAYQEAVDSMGGPSDAIPSSTVQTTPSSRPRPSDGEMNLRTPKQASSPKGVDHTPSNWGDSPYTRSPWGSFPSDLASANVQQATWAYGKGLGGQYSGWNVQSPWIAPPMWPMQGMPGWGTAEQRQVGENEDAWAKGGAAGAAEKSGAHLHPQNHPFMEQSCQEVLGGSPSAPAAVRLRGLPFSAGEQDVLAFFSHYQVADRIADCDKAVSMLLKANGRPSGQAVVQMMSRRDANQAQACLHGQWMGNRYIEVFAYGIDDEDPNFGAGPWSMDLLAGMKNTSGGTSFTRATQDWNSTAAGYAGFPEGGWRGEIKEEDGENKSWESLFGCLSEYHVKPQPEDPLAADIKVTV